MSKVNEIKELLQNGMPAREIAKKVGVSNAYVYQVKNPRNRKRVLSFKKVEPNKANSLSLIEAVITSALAPDTKINIIRSLVN